MPLFVVPFHSSETYVIDELRAHGPPRANRIAIAAYVCSNNL